MKQILWIDRLLEKLATLSSERLQPFLAEFFLPFQLSRRGSAFCTSGTISTSIYFFTYCIALTGESISSVVPGDTFLQWMCNITKWKSFIYITHPIIFETFLGETEIPAECCRRCLTQCQMPGHAAAVQGQQQVTVYLECVAGWLVCEVVWVQSSKKPR